ncbi:MAG: phosphoglycerate dehydrogenase [Anaerolineaceae bacterium]|nr:phosphoglycerate dehydrogenase [Anaerolineaceae bacterium]
MEKILVTCPYMLPFMDRFRPILKTFGYETIEPEVHERFEAEDILQFAHQFVGTLCGDDRYTREVQEACLPELKVISKWGTGIDSIDQQAAKDLGILIGNTPGAFTVPVTESVLAYMLAFARKQPWMDKAMKAGQWQKIPGKTLSESSLGVIGVGNIGKNVLRVAKAFGMKLYGNDIVKIDPVFIEEIGVEMLPLDELLVKADFISLNCTLNLSSKHLINAETLKHCKPEAVLINTCRGPVVHEAALVEALQTGKLAGAALDVFEEEPLPHESALLGMDNVMIAPHNTNSSPYYWERVHWNTLRNLLTGLGKMVDMDTLKAMEEKPYFAGLER